MTLYRKIFIFTIPLLMMIFMSCDTVTSITSPESGTTTPEKPDTDQDPVPDEETDGKTLVIGYMMADDYQYDQLYKTMDWSCLTHIIPSFCYVCGDGSIDTKRMDKHISEIKTRARKENIKISVSFIAASKGEFEKAVQTPESRERLATNIVDYVNKHGLDGLDIDYEEYPGLKANVPNLLDLFSRIRSKAGEKLEMSTSMAPGKWLDYGKEWASYFNYVNLMLYDQRHNTAPDIPVQHSSYEFFVDAIQDVMNRYAIPREKIMAGLPFYGFTWEEGKAKGIRFNQIVDRYPGNQDVINGDRIGDILYNGKKTIRKKTRYVIDQKIGGVMIWQLFQDARKPEDRLIGEIADVLKTVR